MPDVPASLTWSAVVISVLVVLAGIAKAAMDHPPRWMRWRLLLVAAVVSIVVLVGDWADDTWHHRTLIMVLLAAAVAVAATAIITGGLAAFGLPSKHTAASGQILRHRHAKQARTTRSLLRASLYAGTVTLVLMGAAIVLTWTHTP